MEYEDKDANAFTETASVSVPIKQEAKVDLSSISLMPEMLEVGNEANVMFSIYNTGKTTFYNMQVKYEDESVSDVVRRADKTMYENKWESKRQTAAEVE